MIQWFQSWLQARRERIIFEALWALAEMEHARKEDDCHLCNGDLQACICDDGTDCD